MSKLGLIPVDIAHSRFAWVDGYYCQDQPWARFPFPVALLRNRDQGRRWRVVSQETRAVKTTRLAQEPPRDRYRNAGNKGCRDCCQPDRRSKHAAPLLAQFTTEQPKSMVTAGCADDPRGRCRHRGRRSAPAWPVTGKGELRPSRKWHNNASTATKSSPKPRITNQQLETCLAQLRKIAKSAKLQTEID